MKNLFIAFCLTPLIIQFHQVQADLNRIEHENRFGEHFRENDERRLILDTDR